MNMLTAEYNYEKDMAVQRQEAIQKGIQQGIQQGVQQGVQQGIQLGVQQGVQQGATQKEMEIAKKMLDKGLQINDVFLYTGIPMDRIIEIQKSIKKR